ncbi:MULTISPECIES: sulfite exporter TauE/SafE family protein [Thermodesulfovibrio]|uniref:Probable membrane transporter protein n=1 Tax=Thermodesulfovibrio yellowstonii (strain ATCC 51303 / DSM 11347 / YP87) TaxID=289376 RepID=B5YKL1_THEYD|nr:MULTISPECIES: sulfite exporter TauE/SafE family protein [Thermodesulfovibrio]ACI21319.1 membrane protein, putative [Thermodesulfovibrio yellowstonii DSM 11347]MDI6865660.1 sulfite exporter TauE/SafE family protein [Thermodesulfovibrio yellowstonii]
MFDFLTYTFPISGVTTNILIPPLVAFIVSFFTSMGGVSGAFLLLPFQVSALNYTSPGVSGTNFIFNVVAIPSGVYRYHKEKRIPWPLAWVIMIGTVPGIIIGYYIRIKILPDPKSFKFFVGLVLLYIGVRLFFDVLKKKKATAQKKFDQKLTKEATVKTISFSLKKTVYEFWGERFSFSTIWVFLLAFVIGVIGGAYGIGGGAIMSPFLVTFFKLPVHSIAGACLMGTATASVFGVLYYAILPSPEGMQTSPDWLLGLLFGLGGAFGIYLGARVQKHVPQKYIKLILSILIVYVALRYIIQFFY